MRNDLNRLQIRCVNAEQGCEAVLSLERLHAHEDECEFAFVSCSNTGKITQKNMLVSKKTTYLECFFSSDHICRILNGHDPRG